MPDDQDMLAEIANRFMWRITESAPADDTLILGVDENGNRRIVQRQRGYSSRSPDWWATVPGRWPLRMIAWMPLPDPPATIEE